MKNPGDSFPRISLFSLLERGLNGPGLLQTPSQGQCTGLGLCGQSKWGEGVSPWLPQSFVILFPDSFCPFPFHGQNGKMANIGSLYLPGIWSTMFYPKLIFSEVFVFQTYTFSFWSSPLWFCTTASHLQLVKEMSSISRLILLLTWGQYIKLFETANSWLYRNISFCLVGFPGRWWMK